MNRLHAQIESLSNYLLRSSGIAYQFQRMPTLCCQFGIVDCGSFKIAARDCQGQGLVGQSRGWGREGAGVSPNAGADYLWSESMGERGHQLLSITNGTLALNLGAVDFFNCSSEGTKDLDLRRAVCVKEWQQKLILALQYQFQCHQYIFVFFSMCRSSLDKLKWALNSKQIMSLWLCQFLTWPTRQTMTKKSDFRNSENYIW